MEDYKPYVPWYAESEDEKLIKNIMVTVNGLVTASEHRIQKWDVNELLMQENRGDYYVGRTSDYPPYYQRRGSYTAYDGRLRYNVIRGIADALKARISTARPKVRFCTHDSRFSARELARLNTKMMAGIFRASNFYDVSQQIFNDSFMYGIGYARPFGVDGKVRIERVHPRCIFIDEPDYGIPCSWFQIEDVSKFELKKLFPEYENEIDASGLADEGSISRDRKESSFNKEMHGDSRCTAYECWYTTVSGKGRHVIMTNKVVMVDEDWLSEKPGVVDFRFFEAAKGYIGQSFVDQLKEIQKEINYILIKIQDHMNLGGTLKIFLDGSSRIAVDKLTNEHLQIVKYAGTRGLPLQVVQIPAVDRIYFEQIDRLEQKAYNLVGISELFATSEKPAGLESGKALSTYEDIQSARFLHIGQKWQSFFCNVAVSTMALLEGSGATIQVGENKLSGKDFSLGKNMLDISPAVVSLLPDTPPGIIQAVSDYAQMDPDVAADAITLLEDLDLEAYLQRALAPKMVVCKAVDEMLFDHKKWVADQSMHLEYAIKQATLATQQAILRDDEKAKTILMDFISDCNELIQAQQPAQPMPGIPMQGAEGAMLPQQPQQEGAMTVSPEAGDLTAQLV